ncbi:MAG: 50S ribosomal protein L25, partial [Gammaproteobacteria bacterium]
EIIHVDFKGVHMDDKVDVQIPIHLLGKPSGVKDEGGQLHQTLMNVIIRALTINIPTSFEIDVSEMAIGDAIHAKDLELTEGVELVTSPDTLVVNVAHAKGVTEEEELVEEEDEFMFEDDGEETPEEPTEE